LPPYIQQVDPTLILEGGPPVDPEAQAVSPSSPSVPRAPKRIMPNGSCKLREPLIRLVLKQCSLFRAQQPILSFRSGPL
jgi:hypothetical protein